MTNPYFVRIAANPSMLFGKGFGALFNDYSSPVTVAPFPQASRSKAQPMLYDKTAVAQGLRNPVIKQFDPRTLRATQPMVTKDGLAHYMNGNDGTYQFQQNAGNNMPVIYQRADGQNLILSGHHRATAALLQGQPLSAIHIQDPALKTASIPEMKKEDSEHTSGMIALIPSDTYLSKLKVEGGDPTSQLHLTMVYLGEAADWSEEKRKDLLEYIDNSLPNQIKGKAFGHAVFNPDDEEREPASVYLVSDLPQSLLDFHKDLIDTVDDLPEQFDPWQPHITAGFNLDVSKLEYTGSVEFSTLRVTWAGETYDFQLGETNG